MAGKVVRMDVGVAVRSIALITRLTWWQKGNVRHLCMDVVKKVFSKYECIRRAMISRRWSGPHSCIAIYLICFTIFLVTMTTSA